MTASDVLIVDDGGFVTRQELFANISASALELGDMIYVERRGEDYAWKRVDLGTDMPVLGGAVESRPDVWIYYTGPWPFRSDSLEQWRLFFSELLDEMESMAGGMDRCRWAFDEPWPHRH